eukprot:CAMPEP_0196722668 /NCGR_PEP_ID=MMETSP1091-20130531/4971_1 /TAXON_ID=302021 /ORGANISM="Rhodomonas sp., Strain CCMP768" /LENGTH=155 /DNA_ID=CAMNT_0042064417 /DNA_START=68 /DNA_END=532 /DNA_ORIENTATION=-
MSSYARSAPFLQDYTEHNRKAKLCSLFGGVLFGFGWLIFVDAAAWSGFLLQPEGWDVVRYNAVPLFLASVFLFALNLVDIDELRTAQYDYRLGGRARWSLCWLCMCGVLCAMAVISSVVFVVQSTSQSQKLDDSWLAGTAVCGCLFICVGAIVFW